MKIFQIHDYIQHQIWFDLLGDLSLYPKKDADKFIDRLHGNKHLIVGNHDKNILHSTRFGEITLKKNFIYKRFGINIHIVLDHDPHASWDRKIHGSWHLFGHVHGRFGNLSPEIEKFMGLSWDVGIDNQKTYIDFNKRSQTNWCKPVNLYDVVQIMAWKSLIIGVAGPDGLDV